MSIMLQKNLREICQKTGWSYAVFWKLKRRNRMLLSWEDGFYQPPLANSLPSADNEPRQVGNYMQGNHLWPGNTQEDPLCVAVAKMSYHVYSLGVGVIGRVAFTGKHQWVFGGGDKINHLGGASMEYPSGWQNQFAAGIKTIVVIAVGQGVVQLGSTVTVMEDLDLVGYVRTLFLTGNCHKPFPPNYLSGARIGHAQNTSTVAMSLPGFSVSEAGRDVVSSWRPALQANPAVVLPSDIMRKETFPAVSNDCSQMQIFHQTLLLQVLDDQEMHRLLPSAEPQQRVPAQSSLVTQTFKHENAAFLAAVNSTSKSLVVDRSMAGNEIANIEGNLTGDLGLGSNLSRAVSGVPALSPMGLSWMCGCGSSDVDSLHISTSGCTLPPVNGFINSLPNMSGDGSSADCQVVCLTSGYDDTPSPFGRSAGSGSVDGHTGEGPDEYSTFVPGMPKRERPPLFLTPDHSFRDELSEAFCPSTKKSLEMSLPGSHTPTSRMEMQGGSVSVSWSPAVLSGDVGQLAHLMAPASSSGEALAQPLLDSGPGTSCSTSSQTSNVSGFDSTSGSGLWKETKREVSQSCLQVKPMKNWGSGQGLRNERTPEFVSVTKPDQSAGKTGRKRCRPSEAPRPRPKDRQQIQDRVRELRDIVPNTQKCSIDALLERTIKHVELLQCLAQIEGRFKNQFQDQLKSGSNWAVEDGREGACPLVVENLSKPRQMLVEMMCEKRGLLIQVADYIRGLGLTIIKGVMEARYDKIRAQFVVEASRDMHRVEVLLTLMQLLKPSEQSGGLSETATSSACLFEPAMCF